MKKITLLILMLFLSVAGFSQVISEGFEGVAFPPTTPGNWAVFQNGFGSNVWTTNTSLPHTGTKCAQMNSRQNIGLGNTSKDFLATPLVTIPANGQLRFWARTSVNGNQGTKYQIRIASGALPANQTDETAYTTLVQEWTEDQLSTTYNIYEEKIVNLTAFAGQAVYIAFVDEYTQTGTTLSGDTWLLDDILLVSQCLDPTALTANTFTTSSANLSWGNPSGATSWEIEVMPAGPAVPTGSGLVVNSNPYTVTALTAAPFTPLQPGTQYKYYVRALCSIVGSQWVGPFTFSTATLGSTCLAPIVIPSTLPYVTNSNTSLYGNNITGPQGGGCAGGATNYMTGNDVVYSYTAAATTTITITMTPGSAWSGIFVYSSCANIGVSCLAGVANSGTAPRVISNMPVTAGQTYYIVISTNSTPVSTAYNLTIVANTCTNLAATFSVVSDCAIAPQFYVRANVTSMGSATSVVATDNQASPAQTITAPGQVQFGPFPNGTNVTIHLENGQDANCFINSTNQTQGFCPATNDLCSGAIPIACGGTATQTTVGATTTGAPTGTCGTTGGAGGLWYSFVGTGDVVTFSLCGSAYDTKLQVVTGACGAFTCVAGNDDSCGNQSQVVINSVLGTNYYVYVYGYNTAQGVFTLNVSCVPPPPPPANDNCTTAIVVPTNTTEVCLVNASGTTVGATPSTPATITPCLGTADDDVWFEFVATNTTHIINLTNIVGGTTNLNHILYSNTCGALTQMYCSDPNGSIATGLTIGATYKIRVYTSGNVVNQAATFNVCITVPPTNDECVGAIPTPVNTGINCVVFSSGSVSGATASADASTCTGTEDDDVWFSFVATATAHVLSLTNVVGTTTNLNHAVYSGSCGSLVQKYCSAAGSLTSNNATFVVGQTYYVRVWSNVATFQAVNFNLCIGVIPPPITANTTQYTNLQLVQDILLNTTCASVSNVTSSTGTNFGTTNGIGYFDQALSQFPFQNGVVLTTGNAANAPGPNSTTLSDGGAAWPGDANLEAIILAATGAAMNSKNATKLEFDFVPLSSTISFNFIFASEEYGTFQCSFSDAFAFLLTNTVTGVTTNLAIIPNTTTPVSVVTIRNQLYNAGCASVNPAYFSTFYGTGGVNPIGAPINFNGITVPMTATSTVIPGVTYHIKMVIADRSDTSYDSAVFLEGGSFNIGNVDLGADLAGANSICIGDSTTLDSGLDPAAYTITWTQDGVLIPGQTGPTLQVFVPGLYAINAQYGSSTCFATDSVLVEYFQDAVPGTPVDLVLCDASGVGTFDLTQNAPVILAPFAGNHVLSYFLTEADALNNVNPIANPTAYTNIINPQIIYVRVTNTVTNCRQIVTFNLIVQDLTPQFILVGNTAICPDGTSSISVLPTNNNFDPNLVSYVWTFNSVVIPGQTGSSLAINGSAAYGTYTVTVNNSGCTATQTFTITNSNTVWNFVITNPATLCPDETGALSVNVTNNTTGTPVTYTYTLPDMSTIVTLNNSIPVDAPGLYTVDVNILGCISSQSVTIGNSVSNWNFVITNPTTLCPDETGTLSVNVTNNTTGTPVTYTYTLPDMSTVVTLNNSIPVDAPGVYTVDVNILGCVSSQSVTIGQSVSNWDVTFVNEPYIICQNQSVILSFTADNFNISDPNAVYTWTAPDGTQTTGATVSADQVGVYSVEVDIFGCKSSEDVTVSQNTSPLSIAILSGCDANDFKLVANPINNSFDPLTSTYSWAGPSFTVVSGAPNSVILNAVGSYTVTVTTADGCQSEETIVVTSISCEIPKGISPNGDGSNDEFDLTGFNVKKISIFNRYGAEIYMHGEGYTDQWHGQAHNGNELPDGTYYYVIQKGDGNTITGWVFINR